MAFNFDTTYFNIGQEYYDPETNLKWRFIGGASRLQTSWILVDGLVRNDPDTTAWGLNQEGASWYNIIEQQWKGWNGTQVVLKG